MHIMATLNVARPEVWQAGPRLLTLKSTRLKRPDPVNMEVSWHVPQRLLL
jgi:hypothetical protein